MAEMKWGFSYKKYCEILEDRGVDTATVCRETGILESTMANWKARWKENNNSCSADTIKRIADYFNVTVDYFLEQSKV